MELNYEEIKRTASSIQSEANQINFHLGKLLEEEDKILDYWSSKTSLILKEKLKEMYKTLKKDQRSIEDVAHLILNVADVIRAEDEAQERRILEEKAIFAEKLKNKKTK